MASDISFDLGVSLSRRDREGELVARAKAGDHAAYAGLVRPYERVAYRLAVAITGCSEDAEEAMQNGFVKAYRSLHRFRAGAPFKPWLLQIVVNEARNVLRSQRRHARLGTRAAALYEAPAGAADDAVIAQEEAEKIMVALARLPDGDRTALALRYFAELPDVEAAALVEITPAAYRVRLVRARQRLQALLEENDGAA